jgi:hypothetical protein
MVASSVLLDPFLSSSEAEKMRKKIGRVAIFKNK